MSQDWKAGPYCVENCQHGAVGLPSSSGGANEHVLRCEQRRLIDAALDSVQACHSSAHRFHSASLQRFLLLQAISRYRYEDESQTTSILFLFLRDLTKWSIEIPRETRNWWRQPLILEGETALSCFVRQVTELQASCKILLEFAVRIWPWDPIKHLCSWAISLGQALAVSIAEWTNAVISSRCAISRSYLRCGMLWKVNMPGKVLPGLSQEFT